MSKHPAPLSTTRPRAVQLATLALCIGGCRAPAAPGSGGSGAGQAFGLRPVDQWIGSDEVHFKHLWQVTFGGENTRPRWSPDGKQLAFLHSDLAAGIECDQVRVGHLETGALRGLPTSGGVHGLGTFDGTGSALIFASTHEKESRCPAPPDHSRGYVWDLPAGYDLFIADLDGDSVVSLIEGEGYDAEACHLPGAGLLVFTSTRNGDPELWSCTPDGSSSAPLTDLLGYEGAPCASPDGTWIAFHCTPPLDAPEGPDGQRDRARYQATLERGSVAPSALEIAIVRPDGSDGHRVTDLGKANWDPCFTPDGERLIFASNHHGSGPMPTNFDLFLVALNGSGLERVTSFDRGLGRQYDGHPRFSPDGRFLAFSSNRGEGEIGETNLFIAEWQ